MTDDAQKDKKFFEFMEVLSENFPEQVTGSQLSSLIATILYNTVGEQTEDIYPIVLRAMELVLFANEMDLDWDRLMETGPVTYSIH